MFCDFVAKNGNEIIGVNFVDVFLNIIWIMIQGNYIYIYILSFRLCSVLKAHHKSNY